MFSSGINVDLQILDVIAKCYTQWQGIRTSPANDTSVVSRRPAIVQQDGKVSVAVAKLHRVSDTSQLDRLEDQSLSKQVSNRRSRRVNEAANLIYKKPNMETRLCEQQRACEVQSAAILVL